MIYSHMYVAVERGRGPVTKPTRDYQDMKRQLRMHMGLDGRHQDIELSPDRHDRNQQVVTGIVSILLHTRADWHGPEIRTVATRVDKRFSGV